MSFFNMFGGAPKKEEAHDEEKIVSNGSEGFIEEDRKDVAVDMETLEVRTPADLAEEKENQKIPENWREQA